MAAKKKSTNRRKRRRSSKKKWQNFFESKYFLGGVFVLLSLIGYFSLGYVGILVTNIFRLFVGDTFQFLIVVFGLYGLILLFTGKEPKLKGHVHYLTGLGLAYLGVILIMTTRFFEQTNQHNHFIVTTWHALEDAFKYASIGEPVGGGIIGSVLYTITDFCFSEIGSLFLGGLLVILGVAIFFGIPMDKVLQTIAVAVKKSVVTLKAGLMHGGEAIQSWWNHRE